MRPARSLPAPPLADAALAVALAAWALAETGATGALGTGGLLLTTLPLAWRRVAPVAMMAVVAAGFAVTGVPDPPPEPLATLVAILVAPFSVAAHATPRGAVAGLALAVAGAAAAALLVGDDLVFIVLIAVAAWTAGWALGRTTRHHEMELGRQRESAIVAERERIARELHDVVSHGVSLMVVHAGAAEQLLEADPDEARRSLRTIQSTGREAVDDLRRMLGLLRSPGDRGGEPLAPQPGLDGLGRLVASARDAGAEVTLEVSGEPAALPGGIELSAYRIVQESLTNAAKHAPGCPTSVRVAHGPDSLRLVMRTSGAPNGRSPAGGHGLVGIRERVALFGGTVSCGHDPDGDFVVDASLPLP